MGLLAGALRDDAELKDPGTSERDHDEGPQNDREQQGDSQREVTVEDQERELTALLILEDEDEDHRQPNQADNQRGPRHAEAGLSLPGIWFPYRNIVSRRRFVDCHYQSVAPVSM